MPEFHSLQREFNPMYAAADAAAHSPDRIRDEMRDKVRAIAGMSPGQGLKGALAWAARKIGISASEAKRLAYSEITIVPAHIADRVRAASDTLVVEAELHAVDALLARIQREDRHAALVRALEARLLDPSPSSDPSGPGAGSQPRRAA